MSWLHPFIALTLCCGVTLTLLPQGSLRRTAALVIGLMMTICWAESLSALLHWPELPAASPGILMPTGYDPAAALEAYASTLGGE